MPVRDRPACPCAQCALDWAAAPSARHGSMPRYESGCRCADCRMWAVGFRRILEREADEQRFEPFGREPEAASDPQPTQASGAGVLVFELYDEEGAPASDLEGAVATAMIRRIVTPPDAAELPMVAVVLDAGEASARVALSGTQTLALAPAPGESVNRIEVVVKIEAVDDLVHFHGPAQVELWGAF